MIFKRFSLSFYIILISIDLFSQQSFKDTLRISLHQSDSLFLVKNLSLLAEQCNVDAAKAQIIQAKLFQNITFIGNQNVYNTEYRTNGGRPWFDFTDKGETSIEIQKLFLLAGKRNKKIKLAGLSADLEGHTYFDLLRTLKYSLHSSFFNIFYLNHILKVYDKEIASLGKLIQVLQEQYEKEYISRKELLRLKSSLFSLENEKLAYSSQLISALSDFNLLLHSSNIFYLPEPDLKATDNFSPDNLKLQSLIDTALQCRYDLKMAQTDLSINQMNLDYQKALAVPDLTLSGGWDRNGSFVHNYNFLGVQIDVPIFNRNQGNIKSAAYVAESSKYKLESAQEQVKGDVISAYATALEINRLFTHFDSKFMTDLNDMTAEILKNYEKRNISLIEFLDYYDAYKQNAVQYFNYLLNRMNAMENINFSVGTKIVLN